MPHQNEIDLRKHKFNSATFGGVVAEALHFFSSSPAYPLPLKSPFNGGGVYGLYYTGGFEPYLGLSRQNKGNLNTPIYIGKAVPKGWRTSRNHTVADEDRPLYRRLNEHAKNLMLATSTLKLADFHCRFMVLSGPMCEFRRKLDTDSSRSWTVIPRQAGH